LDGITDILRYPIKTELVKTFDILSIFTEIKDSSLLSKIFIISVYNFKASFFYQNIFENCLKIGELSSSVKTIPGHFSQFQGVTYLTPLHFYTVQTHLENTMGTNRLKRRGLKVFIALIGSKDNTMDHLPISCS